ncbi:hypothetical protein EVAR_11969_1 [Eumeta japonica]|uniref:Uncharacterized protein n=1 Tax=Eumeta variegata TaxID=151549 RepID=A0A4C1U542_EUMVA|nr:hypothetical protein EVAR_11969_1 [Eumeta japonica]
MQYAKRGRAGRGLLRRLQSAMHNARCARADAARYTSTKVRPSRPVKHHTLTECRREVVTSANAFRPVSGNPVAYSPLHQPISFSASDILFLSPFQKAYEALVTPSGLLKRYPKIYRLSRVRVTVRHFKISWAVPVALSPAKLWNSEMARVHDCSSMMCPLEGFRAAVLRYPYCAKYI